MTWICPACGSPLVNGRRTKGAGSWRIWFECRCDRWVLVTKSGIYAYPPDTPTDLDLEEFCERMVKKVAAKERTPLKKIAQKRIR